MVDGQERSLQNSSLTQYQRFSVTSLRHQLVTVEPSRRGDAKILLTKPSLQARRQMSPVQSWIQVRIPTQLKMKALIKSGGRLRWTSVDFRQKLHRVRKRSPLRSKRRGSKRAHSQCRPRRYIAALHYNSNADWKICWTSDGDDKCALKFSRGRKQWIIVPLKEGTKFGYIGKLLAGVFERMDKYPSFKAASASLPG
ncbi:uncharacterized protein ISCGN_015875 [Ixodes scapularis]